MESVNTLCSPPGITEACAAVTKFVSEQTPLSYLLNGLWRRLAICRFVLFFFNFTEPFHKQLWLKALLLTSEHCVNEVAHILKELCTI